MGPAVSKTLSEKVNEEQIQKEILESPVVVYTNSDCGYCTMAKELLDKERIGYREHDLKKIQQTDPDEYQKYINGLVYVTRQRTVPQIFICAKFIGGFTQLDKLHKKGKLKEEISRCD